MNNFRTEYSNRNMSLRLKNIFRAMSYLNHLKSPQIQFVHGDIIKDTLILDPEKDWIS